MTTGAIIAVVAIGAGLFLFKDQIALALDIKDATEGDGGGLVETTVEAIVGKDRQITTKEEALEKGGVAGVLTNNLFSNFTQTPLPNDPLFGKNGLFTNPAGFFSGSQDKDLQQQANTVGLTAQDLLNQTDTKQVTVTKLGTSGKKGISAFN